MENKNSQNKKFRISGMSCAACQARVERAVSELDDVESCEVSLLLGTMSVLGSASGADIEAAVRAAGYGIMPLDELKSEDMEERDKEENRKILLRLIISLGLLLLLMYISMGHIMWGFPLPSFLAESYAALALVQLVLSLLTLIVNNKFFINGFLGVLHRAPNMDTLVALGSSASFIYSTVLTVMLLASVFVGDMHTAHGYLHGLYFESAAMIPALITLGKLLEARAKGKTTSELRALMSLSPKTVNRFKDGKEERIPIGELVIGDIFTVRRGESIAADGIIIEGEGAFDESSLTGESIPSDKGVGGRVFGGSMLHSGFVKIKAEAVGEDTAISEIIRMVREASTGKAPVAKVADRVAGVFVPVVMVISLITALIWLLIRQNIGFALARAVSVLVISCPCALGLATPVAIMVGSGVGAKNKILYKSAAALEMSGRIEVVCLDKTGTITEGKPHVSDIIPIGINESELLLLAASLENASEHPLARAIVDYYGKKTEACTAFVSGLGGVMGRVRGEMLYGGNVEFIERKLSLQITDDVRHTINMLSEEGKTSLVFAGEGQMLGIIALKDRIKEDSKAAVEALGRMGIRTVMLTGDNPECARAVANEVGIDEVYSGIFPGEKQTKVELLRREGRVAMVGDGVNDAPALALADVGIAIGAGANVAIESADVVLSRGSLVDAANTIALGRATLRNIYENLFWAFIYNIIGIPLAAGAFIPLGLTLEPMFGAVAMSISSFLVVMNALRLGLFRGVNVNKDSQLNPNAINNKIESEEKIMNKTVTIKIEGMMCPHCSGRVRTALLSLTGVTAADVSHERGDAVITLSSELELSVLEAAITDAGYNVI